MTPASNKLAPVYFEKGVSSGFNTRGTALSCEMWLTPEPWLEQPAAASTCNWVRASPEEDKRPWTDHPVIPFPVLFHMGDG